MIDLDPLFALNDDRKKRLFSIALARHPNVIKNFPLESKNAVHTAELFLEGLTNKEQLAEAYLEAPICRLRPSMYSDWDLGYICASDYASLSFKNSLQNVIKEWIENSPSCPSEAILQDIIPFPAKFEKVSLCAVPKEEEESFDSKRPCKTCQSILSWNNHTVRNIAENIYQNKSWQEMPVLGDALIDAGCKNKDILDHCHARFHPCPRCTPSNNLTQDYNKEACTTCSCCHNKGWVPAYHARGCWVVDLLLNK